MTVIDAAVALVVGIVDADAEGLADARAVGVGEAEADGEGQGVPLGLADAVAVCGTGVITVLAVPQFELPVPGGAGMNAVSAAPAMNDKTM
jgi:hypothetical protein